MEKLIRRCAQCREPKHRSHLLRLQLGADGSLVLGGKGLGRSLYLCPTGPCLQRATRNKAIPRLLPGLNPELWRSWCQAKALALTSENPSPSS